MSRSDDLAGTSAPTRAARLSRPARRTQLLAAAQQLFVDRGYHATGMDEIAERAGVSKPVLYQHFPGKLELYLALVDEAGEQIVEAVVAAMNSTTDGRQRILATMEAYFRFVSAEGASYRLVFESDLTNDAEVRRRVDGAEARTTYAVARVISADAGLPSREALLLAASVVGMAKSAAQFWLGQGQVPPLTTAAGLVASLAWRGIAAHPRIAPEHAD